MNLARIFLFDIVCLLYSHVFAIQGQMILLIVCGVLARWRRQYLYFYIVKWPIMSGLKVQPDRSFYGRVLPSIHGLYLVLLNNICSIKCLDPPLHEGITQLHFILDLHFHQYININEVVTENMRAGLIEILYRSIILIIVLLIGISV